MTEVSNHRRGLQTGALFAVGLAIIAPMASCTMPDLPISEEGVTDVLMQAIAFVPAEVTITVGQRVRWTNLDPVLHTTTNGNPGDADAGAIWDSGNMASGDTFEHQFEEEGEFIYFCEIHPGIMLNAKVTVEP